MAKCKMLGGENCKRTDVELYFSDYDDGGTLVLSFPDGSRYEVKRTDLLRTIERAEQEDRDILDGLSVDG